MIGVVFYHRILFFPFGMMRSRRPQITKEVCRCQAPCFVFTAVRRRESPLSRIKLFYLLW